MSMILPDFQIEQNISAFRKNELDSIETQLAIDLGVPPA